MNELDFQRYVNEVLNRGAANATRWLTERFGISGWWANVIDLVVAGLAQCVFMPREGGNRLKSALAQQAADFTRQVDRPRQVTLPPGRQPFHVSLTVETSGGQVPVGQSVLVVPFTQDVQIRWNIYGHASVCSESVAVADIVGSGWQREVWGQRALLNPQTRTDSGEVVRRMNAGVYLVRVAGANQYSGGSVTVNYQSVEDVSIPADPTRVAAAAAVGLGAAGVLYGLYRLAREV